MHAMTRAALETDAADPGDAAWEAVSPVALPLVPVPLDDQPNAYVRAAWRERPYGRTAVVTMRVAAHDDRLLVHLAWDGSEEQQTGEFPDACGVFFPQVSGTAGPRTLGSHAEPVSLWLWRDRPAVQQGLPSARPLVARGPGVFRPDPAGEQVTARSRRDGTRWSVVLRGPLHALDGAHRVGVVVWQGANEERAGIGAVTEAWAEVAP